MNRLLTVLMIGGAICLAQGIKFTHVKAAVADKVNPSATIFLQSSGALPSVSPGLWEVLVVNAAGISTGRMTPTATHAVSLTAVVLDIAGPTLPADFAYLEVRYLGFPQTITARATGGALNVPSPDPGQPVPFRLSSADTKEEADFYFSGIISPSLSGGDTLYSLDGKLALQTWLNGKKPIAGRIGFLGEFQSDKRKDLDLDSFNIGGNYRSILISHWHGPMQGLIFNWDFVRFSFDRDATTRNTVTAPRLEAPLRLIYAPRRAGKPLLTLRPAFGGEIGENSSVPADPAAQTGQIRRALLSGDLRLRLAPNLPIIQRIVLSSRLEHRVLSRPEIVTRSITDPQTQKPKDVYWFDKSSRTYLDTKLNLIFNDYFGVTFRHAVGSRPPLFREADHSLTITLTFLGSVGATQ